MKSETHKVKLNCGSMFITISKDSEGNPFEVFIQLGKAVGCIGSHCNKDGRLISLLLRSGVPVSEIVKQLRRTMPCPEAKKVDGVVYLSCAEAIAKVLEEVK